MTAHDACPPTTLTPGVTVAGFRIERVDPVPELRARAYQAVHTLTGLQVLHLHLEDRDNLYAIVLRTPPADSTGVAHILEHSVLAGSQRYPVKDAYNELRRGSLSTFMNAFTAPDWTCYPIASQVRADFYNLARVYTDLALRPLLARTTFMREGHHLAFDAEDRLTISGIVYNEMKGAFSTPERIGQAITLQSLFPGSPYGVESGGRPEAIPELTYAAFREFHHRFYSPSNARVYFYGDLPTRDHLEFLAGELEGFGPIAVDSRVPDTVRWTQPRTVSEPFPVGSDDAIEKRSAVNIAWLTAQAGSLEERLKLEVLQEALVGNAAAPLRKALIDSGLGEDLSPATGLSTWYKEMPFAVGLRGTEPERAAEIEELTLETLAGLARDGVPREMLEAALHQVEFRGLEISRSSTPFSLDLLFRSLSTWLHEGDPLLPLSFPSLMKELRRAWTADERLFERAISRWLVDNPHRVRATIHPSRTLAAEREAQLRAELDRRQAAMSAADAAAIRTDMEALERDQVQGDTTAALAALPQLALADIPDEIERIPAARGEIGGVTVHEHDVFSNEIAYLDVAFDVSDVPEDLQLYLPLLGGAATGMGAAGTGYEAFATRKALGTGTISDELTAFARVDGGAPVQLFILHASALRRNAAEMVGILRDILTRGDLDDRARLRDILSEQRNSLRAAVAPQGHLCARRTAAAGLSDAAWREEHWYGAPQIRFLAALVRDHDARAGEVRERLGRLRELVFRRDRMLLNLTGDETTLATLRGPLAELVAAMPAGPPAVAGATIVRIPENRAIAIPGAVTYVARVAAVPGYASEEAPPLWVLANHLRTGFLYKKIRVEGGAYGGFSVYEPTERLFAMLSYRDPHLERTLETYDAAVEAFLSEPLGADDLRTTIIGSIARLDTPLDPWQKGRTALKRALQGLDDDLRARFRRGVLEVDRGKLQAVARGALAAAIPSACQAVYAPRERIEAANQALAKPFAIATLE